MSFLMSNTNHKTPLLGYDHWKCIMIVCLGLLTYWGTIKSDHILFVLCFLKSQSYAKKSSYKFVIIANWSHVISLLVEVLSDMTQNYNGEKRQTQAKEKQQSTNILPHLPSPEKARPSHKHAKLKLHTAANRQKANTDQHHPWSPPSSQQTDHPS